MGSAQYMATLCYCSTGQKGRRTHILQLSAFFAQYLCIIFFSKKKNQKDILSHNVKEVKRKGIFVFIVLSYFITNF